MCLFVNAAAPEESTPGEGAVGGVDEAGDKEGVEPHNDVAGAEESGGAKKKKKKKKKKGGGGDSGELADPYFLHPVGNPTGECT